MEVCELWVEMMQGPSASQIHGSDFLDENNTSKCPGAIAIDCEMVGGGSDGSLDLCARVCLVDEDENLILHTFVQPQIPVTNYRYFKVVCVLFL